MPKNKKKIEVFTVQVETSESFTFHQLISSKEVKERDEIKIKSKDIYLRILENNTDFIIGLVETSRNDNIPPKKNRKDKTISKLGLKDDEGLAYANIFIYEKKRSILMYEVNKFGCFVDHFIDYIYKCCQNSSKFTAFSINISPLLNINEYLRLQSFTFHKSIEIQIANPTDIIEKYNHKNDAIFNVCSSASSMGSKRVTAKFEVSAQKDNIGLASKSVRELIDGALKILNGPLGDNIKKINVVGYETDSDDDKLQTIDLIADRYLKEIELEEPRENIDLLERQRKTQIKELYENCIKDFDTIFGK